MKPVRWIPALSILASLLFATPALPTAAAQTRVLRVKAVADEAFREKKNWEKEIQEHIEWSDKEFRKMAGIGLQLVGIDRWTTHQADDMPLLLNELRVGVEKGDADIVVGFTGHKVEEIIIPIGGDLIAIKLSAILGIALPFGDRAVVRRDDDKKETRHTLLHEVLHLFGGMHVKEKSILYTYAGKSDFVLDPFNQRVFELMRARDFNQDIHEIDRKDLDALIALYRQRPLRDERDFENNIRVGYLLLVRGEVDDAIKEFERAIDIDPSRTFSVIRGLIIPELETYFQEHGGTVLSRYTLGRAYASVREWGKAASHFTPNCFGAEGHAPSCNGLGGMLIQATRLDAAEQALVRAVELDDSLVLAHNNLGIVYAATGRMDDAVKHFNRALELSPGDSSVLFNMGLGYLYLDMLDAAVQSFRRSLELDPKNDSARAKLAVALARQGESKEAKDHVRKLEEAKEVLDLGFIRFEIQVLPANAYRDMAEVYFRAGDNKKAWNYLSEAKKKGTNVTDLEQEMMAGSPKAPKKAKTDDLIAQGRAYLGEKQYTLARKSLEQARAQDPKKEEIYYWLGRVARAEGKPEEAVQYQQKAAAMKQKYTAPHLELARMAVDRRDYSTAATHLKQYKEFGGESSEGHFLLGLCQYQLSDLAGAEASLREAIRLDTDYGDAFYLLGALYSKQQRKQEAIAELTLAVDTRTLRSVWRPDAHYNLAVLLLETGKPEQAWKHARTAQRMGHGNIDWVLEELAKSSPEPAGSSDTEESAMENSPPAPRGRPVAMTLPPFPPGKDYHLTGVVLGDPPGSVRQGQLNRGLLRLERTGGTGGQLAISLRIGPTNSKQFSSWVFFPLELAEDEEEDGGEIEFYFMLPPNVATEGEFRAAVSVATPPSAGAMPRALSNEVEVKFRVEP